MITWKNRPIDCSVKEIDLQKKIELQQNELNKTVLCEKITYNANFHVDGTWKLASSSWHLIVLLISVNSET